ncbi:gfo/Idh/MocA family oxidoreductase [Verminephrobacter aporrectodeae subsp. tuberculatae]|uniref:Gfo/Idh/MocA family protein n=1 Tax=Verminephrobacter aporrectodeae TaxID=1110389 RepID=UPI002243DE62|nr:Gfo/Idh/MocA family oxidoreductase [Verminephrobacter aporrectodeae]MCW8164916.1 gfo/Idh/MocA family oxidoreductase [Verminephrobacter aporrectodeae subsp. tuberculatae]MCW8168609.1 gfo/Idh/MocA family oxidoreductase [Verminephrobacter aporrectodeae subsp. tuberculatae]
MQPVNIGIIGCGNISDTYFNGAKGSDLVRVKACADLRTEAAQAKALQHGVCAMSVQALLDDPDIEIVVNLTVPQAHAPVSEQILAAGKHVYLEKPLASDFGAAQRLLAHAATRGLRVGCAPDTFLGAGHQACRAAIDAGRIGRPIGGSVAMLSRGMESWHPNPEFFFKPGGGPMHDVGVYYVTQLVNLLGPVARVSGCASVGLPQRTVGSEPLRGQVIDVEVPTTVHGVLEFVNGANVAMSVSWDVWAHQRAPIEIYGTEGSLLGVDPNWFGGTPRLSERGGPWQPMDTSAHPFGVENYTPNAGARVANYRGVGLTEMVLAMHRGRPHRACGALALHVLEVLDAFGRSSGNGRHLGIECKIDRPEPVPIGADENVFL